jgi:hypothetical protein
MSSSPHHKICEGTMGGKLSWLSDIGGDDMCEVGGNIDDSMCEDPSP